MKFENLLNEALDSTNWLNLQTDTSNKSEYKDSAFSETSENIQKLLEEPDQSNVIFISPEFGLGVDFLLFDKEIIPNSILIKDHVVSNGSNVNYLHLYKYHDIPFVLAEFRDTYEYGFVFMGKDKFDELNSKVFPNTAGSIQMADGDIDTTQEISEEPLQDEGLDLGEESEPTEDEFGSASSESESEGLDLQSEDFPQMQDTEEEPQKSTSLLDG